MFGVARILGHEPLQKIDVALKAPRSLVQAGGFRAVLYSRYILRTPGIDSNDDQAQAEHRDSHHALLSILIFESGCLGRHFLKPAVFAVGFQRIGARAEKTMGIVRTPGGVPTQTKKAPSSERGGQGANASSALLDGDRVVLERARRSQPADRCLRHVEGSRHVSLHFARSEPLNDFATLMGCQTLRPSDFHATDLPTLPPA